MIRLFNKSITIKQIQFGILILFFLMLYMMNYTPPYQLLAILFMGIQLFRFFSKDGIVTFRCSKYIVYQTILIAFFCIHTYFFSQYVNQSMSCLKTLIWNYALLFLMDDFFEEKIDVEKLLHALIFCIIITDIFIIIYTKGTGLNGRMAHGVPRPIWGSSSVTYVSMEFSNISVYATLICLYFYNKVKSWKYLIPISLFAVVIVLSGSRKSIVFLFASVFLFVFSLQDKKNYIKLIKLVFIAIIVLIIAAIAIMKIPALYELIGYRFAGYISGVTTGEFTESSAESRNIMKVTALSLFYQNPFIGYGIDTFRKFPGSFGTWSHNNYLELLVGCGCFSLIVYYWYHIYAIVQLWKIKEEDTLNKMLIILILCILIFDFITVSYMSRPDQIWLMLSGTWLRLVKSKEETK